MASLRAVGVSRHDECDLTLPVLGDLPAGRWPTHSGKQAGSMGKCVWQQKQRRVLGINLSCVGQEAGAGSSPSMHAARLCGDQQAERANMPAPTPLSRLAPERQIDHVKSK